MNTYFGGKPQNPKFIDLVREREIKETTARLLVQKSNVSDDLVSRLGLETELEGHKGCVNCLEWSESGEILASTSDDMGIFLWNAFTHKKLRGFDTRHTGNVFSVKFMPKSNSNIVASGAADARVRVHDLSILEVLLSCSCHTARVKRLATAENTPFLLWSAGEDGLVLQHDLRTPHNCETDCQTILIDLGAHMGRTAEAKCIAVNPTRPELIAVGANDAYVRMYDRRMIRLRRQMKSSRWEAALPDNSIPVYCARYLIPGHLRSRQRNSMRSFAATYLTFSSDGTELLVNMGREHIYLFDINSPRQKRLFDVPAETSGKKSGFFLGGSQQEDESTQFLLSSAYGTDVEDTKDYTLLNTKVLPDHVEELKKQANNHFQLEKYVTATELYNKALGYCPTASVLYGNRAAALMKRRWDGDVYAALRDCQTTLLLDPDHVKAHFRLARCLFDLDRPYEAYRVIQDFEEAFPDYANNSARRGLKHDITQVIERVATASFEHVETLSAFEEVWRNEPIDYKLRYCGHCNTTTDIKEANFFGSEGQYIIAGSDDGNIFIWDRHTTNIVRILCGDAKVVNCLQPHPTSCLVATSGIDSVIRLWSPLPEDDKPNERQRTHHEEIATANQIRMNCDPFELMMMNMGYGSSRRVATLDEEPEDDRAEPVILRAPNCRPS